MEITMKLAIETYCELSGYSFEYVTSQCLGGNKVIAESIMMLMFSVAMPEKE